MKPFLVIIFLMFSALSFGQETESSLNWLTNLEKAEKISQQTNKPILLYFTGSDWCPPCKGLKKDFFETEEFAARADKYVLVLIDLPRRMDIVSEEQLVYNKKIVKKYNKDNSFPKLLVLNHSGKELGMLSGYSSYSTYQDTSYHFAFVDKFASSN
ncbi:thioredoxin family protein [Ulvibacter litoralis]|uniref:Thioredoxin-related protein n=1 Tax=Ulvibacter litoralis TaxID=227084 RepID=A0A1G7F7X4_9FLAO|nr:thioredoxin family protein [Ulvibacter litoralis]SDE72033.1 Thioredoxin-related protein [Ulvibacter litoralis]